MQHTSETKSVAIVWLGLRALSRPSESPAPNVTDTLGANSVSRNTSSAPRKSLWTQEMLSLCGVLRTIVKHECSKQFCEICKQNRQVGHLSYVRPLKDVLPTNADKVLYVFYDFVTTQNKRYSDTAKANETKLICVQQFCARCEEAECDIH